MAEAAYGAEAESEQRDHIDGGRTEAAKAVAKRYFTAMSHYIPKDIAETYQQTFCPHQSHGVTRNLTTTAVLGMLANHSRKAGQYVYRRGHAGLAAVLVLGALANAGLNAALCLDHPLNPLRGQGRRVGSTADWETVARKTRYAAHMVTDLVR